MYKSSLPSLNAYFEILVCFVNFSKHYLFYQLFFKTFKKKYYVDRSKSNNKKGQIYKCNFHITRHFSSLARTTDTLNRLLLYTSKQKKFCCAQMTTIKSLLYHGQKQHLQSNNCHNHLAFLKKTFKTQLITKSFQTGARISKSCQKHSVCRVVDDQDVMGKHRGVQRRGGKLVKILASSLGTVGTKIY